MVVPHGHVVARALHHRRHHGEVLPPLAQGEHVAREGVLEGDAGGVVGRDDVGEHREAARLLLLLHARRGGQPVAVDAGVVLDVALAEHENHDERVRLAAGHGRAVDFAGRGHGGLHVGGVDAQAVERIERGRAQVGPRGVVALLPAQQGRAVAAGRQGHEARGAQRSGRGHEHERGHHHAPAPAHGGPSCRHVPPAHGQRHGRHHGHGDGRGRGGAGGAPVGGDELSGLLRVGLGQQGGGVGRDVHLEVEPQKRIGGGEHDGRHQARRFHHRAPRTARHGHGGCAQGREEGRHGNPLQGRHGLVVLPQVGQQIAPCAAGEERPQ